MLITIYASGCEHQCALAETHQKGFHQFNFKLIPWAPLDWHVWPQSQPSPYVMHFTFVSESGSLYFYWKFAKPNKSKSTGVKKNWRHGCGFGLPEGEALLCGNKSCCWLDKLCMGFRRCDAKDLNRSREGHPNWYEEEIFFSAEALHRHCHPGLFMTRLFGACGPTWNLFKKTQQGHVCSVCRGDKRTIVAPKFYHFQCKLHRNRHISMRVMSIYMTLVDIWAIFAKHIQHFPVTACYEALALTEQLEPSKSKLYKCIKLWNSPFHLVQHDSRREQRHVGYLWPWHVCPSLLSRIKGGKQTVIFFFIFLRRSDFCEQQGSQVGRQTVL